MLVQKEVADRNRAPAGSAEYGAITAAVAYYGRAEKLFKVSAGSFYARAEGRFSRVKNRPIDEQPPVEVTDEKKLFRLIKGAFGNRRKTLLNCLLAAFSQLGGREELEKIIRSCEIDPGCRGERCQLQQFADLSNALELCEKNN